MTQSWINWCHQIWRSMCKCCFSVEALLEPFLSSWSKHSWLFLVNHHIYDLSLLRMWVRWAFNASLDPNWTENNSPPDKTIPLYTLEACFHDMALSAVPLASIILHASEDLSNPFSVSVYFFSAAGTCQKTVKIRGVKKWRIHRTRSRWRRLGGAT